MIERQDQLELLALIEGELNEADAAKFRRRLADEPRVLAAIDQMKTQRTALRAMGEPELPEDFLVRLEPVLARAMLAEPLEAGAPPQYSKPGSYRREYRRQHMRMRWDRMALAAVVLLAAIAGIWASVTGVFAPQPTNTNRSVALMPAPPVRSENQPAQVPLEGTIHHAFTAPSLDRTSIVRSGMNGVAASTDTATLEPSTAKPIVAGFAIVIRSDDRAAVEQAMIAAATTANNAGTIVRNFSYAEAERLAKEWMLANRGATPNDPALASGSAMPGRQRDAQLNSLAQRVREQLQNYSNINASSQDDSTGTPIVGDGAFAPSLEQQLDLSQRGATHCIAVPAREVGSLLERLAMQGNHASILRVFKPAVGQSQPLSTRIDADDLLSIWVNEGPQVRHELNRLSLAAPSTIVLVPVIVD